MLHAQRTNTLAIIKGRRAPILSSFRVTVRHRKMPIHSVLLAALVSQPGTAHFKSLLVPLACFAPWVRKPTPNGDAFVGLRFSKQSAQ